MTERNWWVGNGSYTWTSKLEPDTIYTFHDSDLYWRKDKDQMTTAIERIADERREKKARERIEQAYALLDELGLEHAAEGHVLRFDVGTEDDPRTYVALHVSDRWWVTGGSAPNGVTTEDLLAWMIRKEVDPVRVEWLT